MSKWFYISFVFSLYPLHHPAFWRTLAPFLLQLPCKGRKNKWITWPLVDFGVNITPLYGWRGFSDTSKALSRGLETSSITWGNYSCHGSLSTVFGVKSRPWIQLAATYSQIFHCSTPFSWPISHEAPFVPRTVHALAHLGAFADPDPSAPNVPFRHLCLANTSSCFYAQLLNCPLTT